MRYKILRSRDTDTLTNEVQFHLDRGWKPQGGISLGTLHFKYGTNEEYYVQAIVKEDSK